MNFVKSSLIISAVILQLTTRASTQTDKLPITLEDVLNSEFSAAGYGGTWISDNLLQTTASGNVSHYDVESGLTQTFGYGPAILEHLTNEGSVLSSVSISPDGEYMLIIHSRKNLWRSSFTAKYDIFNRNLTHPAFWPLLPANVTEQGELQLVRWASKGNALAFVYGNNIHYRASAAQGSPLVIQLTDDGSSTISNGHADWVYEEEMFGTNNAMWFSEDGTKLAYVKFDDTNVETFTFSKYGEPGNQETVYPELITIPYPKSGQTNPKYSIHVVSGLDQTTPTTELVNGAPDEYIASVQWQNATNLLVVTINRNQNFARTYSCAVDRCLIVLSYTEPQGWIDVYTPRLNADRTSFLTLQFVVQDPNNKFKHIVIKEVDSTDGVSSITSGNFHVDSILGWDEIGQKIYFSATRYHANNDTSDATQSHIYWIDDNPTTTDKPFCLTCDVTNVDHPTEFCESNSAGFSANFTYYVHTCRGPNIPFTVIRNSTSNAITRAMTYNQPLREKIANRTQPEIFHVEVPMSSNYTANVKLFFPEGYKDTEKYPLLIDVYGGPSSQQVGRSYGVNWGTSLVSDKKIIYGVIDGRGSGRRSAGLLFELNRKLGTVEIEDQIAVAERLIRTLPSIDANKTAIWGWSYGGYATAMVMAKDTENVFKCGISVAPVTSWLYYDTIYTERYMKTPSDNNQSYIDSDVNLQVENFRNKQFMLVHGNADDNVHYQQSMILARALEKSDIMFQQLSYPDESHGINGPGMRKHLYHSLEKFLFEECFTTTETDPETTDAPTTNEPETTDAPTTTEPSATTQGSARGAPTNFFFTLTLAIFAFSSIFTILN